MRVGAASALVLLLLAGCTGGGGGAQGTGPSPQDIEVESSAVGAISGVVVDEAIRPLAGVTITLLTHGQEVVTAEDGLFSFVDLAPGFYAMGAQKATYLPAQVTADVVGGETAKVKVQLATDPTPQPYHVTYKLDGYMQAWATIAEYELQESAGQAAPLCECRLPFTPEAVPDTIVYEAFWQEATPNPGGFEYYWVVDQEQDGGSARNAEYCTSPCQARFSGSDYQAGVPAYARLDGPDEWAVYDQRFQLFLTLFYNGPAPEGWTVLDSA